MTGHAVLVTPPAVEPLSTSEAKAHLRVDFSDDDTYIGSLVTAARAALESQLNRALITQTWDYYLDYFPGASIRLPFGQLQSVTSLKYVDSDDAETVVASSVYDVVTWEDPGRVMLSYGQSWPSATLRSAGGVVVRYVCGWEDADAVPQPLKQAMLLQIGSWYENREDVMVGQGLVKIDLAAANALAWPYRILSV